MRKNIIGFLAIALAFTASAFTTAKPAKNKAFTNLKWFTISGTVAPNDPVPQANATYIMGADGPSVPLNSCSGSTKQCISGFAASQVTPSNTLNGTQTPVDHTTLRN